MGVLPDINEMDEGQFRMWTAQKLIDQDVKLDKIDNGIKAMKWWHRSASLIGGIIGGIGAVLGLKQTGV